LKFVFGSNSKNAFKETWRMHQRRLKGLGDNSKLLGLE
jgi:hypothetical protein